MLALYRRALAARRTEAAMGDGPMEWADAPEGCLAWRRGEVTVAVNFSDRPVAYQHPGPETLVASGPVPDGVLPACTAAWWGPPARA